MDKNDVTNTPGTTFEDNIDRELVINIHKSPVQDTLNNDICLDEGDTVPSSSIDAFVGNDGIAGITEYVNTKTIDNDSGLIQAEYTSTTANSFPSSSSSYREQSISRNIFDKIGSSFRKATASLGFEKNFKTMTIDDIDKATTVSGALASLRLVNDRLNGGVRTTNATANETLVFACLHCLIRVLSSPTHGSECSRAIGRLGGIPLLSAVLGQLISNQEVVWRGIHVIQLLSSEPSNCEVMGKNNYCEIVSTVLRSSIERIHIPGGEGELNESLIHVLKATKLLCECSNNQYRFFALNTCSSVMKILHTTHQQQAVSSTVTEWCFRVIYNLSYDNDAVKTAFLQQNCTQTIVRLLAAAAVSERDTATQSLMEWASRALSSLSQQHDDNKQAFFDARGCETISSLLLTSIKTNRANLLLQEALLNTISNTSYPCLNNQASYVAQEGLCVAVVEILKQGLERVRSSVLGERCIETPLLDHLQCIEGSLRAIRSLAQDYEDGTCLLINLHAHSHVIASLRYFGSECQAAVLATHTHVNASLQSATTTHSHVNASLQSAASSIESITQWSLFALSSVSSTADRLKLLADESTCIYVSASLQKQVESSSVSHWACHAISKLAAVAANAVLLEEASVCKGISLALAKHSADEDVVEEACTAVTALCLGYDVCRGSFGSVATAERLVAAAMKHITKQRMMMTLLPAIAALAGCTYGITRICAKDPIATKLCAAGAVKIVCKAFKLHHSSSVLTKACFECIIIFCASSDGCAKEFGSGEVCSSMEQAMCYHAHDTNLVTLFLKSILSLLTHDGNLKRFVSNGVLRWVPSLLDHFMDMETVVAIACQVLSELSTDNDCVEKLGSFSTTELLVLVLSGHRKSELISAWACRTVARLSSSPKHSKRFGEDGCCSVIAAVMTTHNDRAILCQFGCEAVAALAAQSPTNRLKMAQAGIPEVLVSVLCTHSESDVVTAAGLSAVAAIAECSAANQTALISASASTVIITAISRFTYQSAMPADTDCAKVAVQFGCASLARLLSGGSGSGSKEGIQRRVAEEGGCVAVTAALDSYFDSISVALPALETIAQLATDFSDNAVIFIAIAAAEAVYRTVRYHISSEVISLAGVNALITFKSPSGVLCSETVCNLIPIILHRHSAVDRIVESTCRLIYLLCKGFSSNPDNEQNRNMLGKGNACEEVVAALERHTSNEASLLITSSSSRAGSALAVQWACLAIYVLGHEHPNHQERFGRCGACTSVGRAVSSSNNGFAYSETAAYAACQAICALAKNNTKHQIALGNAGACSSIIEALHQHPASVGIARWGLLAVSVLAENSELNSSRFGDSGATNIIPLTLHTHQTSAPVALSGCAAIKSIANVSLTYTAELGQYGACECAIAALNLHMDEVRVVAEGLRAISSLARYLGNASWFGPARAAEAIMLAVARHIEDVSVVTSAYSAVERLCIDSYMAERLGVQDALAIAVDVLSKHSDVEVTLVVCRAISRLVKGGSMQSKLNSCFVQLCKVLVDELERYNKKSVEVIIECCRALVYLLKNVSDDVEDAKSFLSIVPNSTITNARAIDIKSLQIMLSGMGICKVIGNIFLSLLGSFDPASGLTSSLGARVFDAVDISDFTDHTVTSLFKFLCSLTHFIARNNEHTQHEFNEQGVVGSVVSSLEIMIACGGGSGATEVSDAVVQAQLAAVTAISSLTNGNSTKAAANRDSMGGSFACEAVAVLTSRYLTGSDTKSTEMAAAFVCQRGRARVFRFSGNGTTTTTRSKQIKQTESSTLSQSQPASHALTSALTLLVIRNCCNAANNLLQQNKDNRSRFSLAGLSDILLVVLSDPRFTHVLTSITLRVDKEAKTIEFMDNSIIEYALLSLHAISSDPIGKEKLSSNALTTARTIVNIATTKEDANGLVLFLCCSIIRSLCCDNAEDLQAAFGAAGAPAVLVTVLQKLCTFWFCSVSSAGSVVEAVTEQKSIPAKTRRTSMIDSLAAIMPSIATDQPPAASMSQQKRWLSISGGGLAKNAPQPLVSPFSSSFSMDSSKALVDEILKAILELVNCDSNFNTQQTKINGDNVYRFKSLLCETAMSQGYIGSDVGLGGRDVVSFVLSQFAPEAASSASQQYQVEGGSVSTYQLASRVLEVVAQQMPQIITNRAGTGDLNSAAVPGTFSGSMNRGTHDSSSGE